MDWYIKVLKQYVDFNGRARRTEYGMFVLFNAIIAFVLGLVDGFVGTGGILGTVYGLAVLLPGIAVGARRLHDIGRTGWWLLIGFIPLLGLLVLIFFFVQDSHEGDNEYGANPKMAA